MRHLVFLLCALPLACGGAPALPSVPSVPPSPTAASPKDAPASPPSSEPCDASFAKKKPAGWVDVGTLVVQVKDDMPTGWELKDASGKKVDGGDISVKSARAAADMVSQKICRVGGVLAVYDEKAPQSGSMSAVVVKPAKEDEAGDVATMCKPLSEEIMKIKPDESQQLRIAIQVYEESLTSKKWRGWVRDWAQKMRKADPTAAPGLRKSQGQELETAAKGAGIKSCWFATSLARP